VFADITEADARAKGYIKGKLKVEEVFSLLKRTTSSTTIYKKQKLDRDDVVDITDFDVVAWLKSEMRMMLDEEIARAVLIGDGRLASSDDKIKEDCVRPIWTDADLYTIKTSFDVEADTTDSEKAKAFIKAAIKSRKSYKGSGDPTMYMTEDMLTDCLLIEDTTGRTIYDSVAKLATTLRVKEIVTVPVMESQTRTAGTDTMTLHGIIVNLEDYNIGADKGGAVNMFDDFDIDYNAQKYLIETRASGALIKPYSAIVIESKEVEAAG
jgi:HK97 family phage major capsid protein